MTDCCMQEFCNGGSVAEAVDAGCFTSRDMPQRWDPVLWLLRGITEGVDHMHSKRICHGDLNPSNVLLKVCAGDPAPCPVPCLHS
jgi:serine/threonine protein kinase